MTRTGWKRFAFAKSEPVINSSFWNLSDTKFDQELPNYIPDIPKEYYEQYHLIFSHFDLDKKIVRIGRNERQKRSARLTNDYRGFRQANEAWNSTEISRKTGHIQRITPVGSKISRSQHLLNWDCRYGVAPQAIHKDSWSLVKIPLLDKPNIW